MVMTFKEQQLRYRRKLQRSAKLVERIAKLEGDEETTSLLNELIMDARNIVDHQEG